MFSRDSVATRLLREFKIILDCDLKGRLLQWQEHGIYGHSISSFVLSVIMIY